MKRLFPLLLALLLLLPAAAACKNDEKPPETDTGDDTVEEMDIGLPSRSFNEATFRILDANDHPELHVNYSETADGTAVQQALYSRDAYVEKAYGLFLEYTQENNTGGAAISKFTNSFDAGDRNYDMIVSTLNFSEESGSRLTALATSGYLADLAELPTLELDEKWWSAQMYEQMNLGGKMYFSTGDIMASVYDAPMVIYANKTLLAQYEITDDLYAKVDDGSWTLEYMADLVKDADRDLDDDGVMSVKSDFYGFVSQPLRLTVQGLLVGMGYQLSGVVEDTVLVNVDTDISGYADRIKKAVSPVTIQWTKGETTDDVINSAFKNDRAIFLCHLIEAATHGLKDMASDYAILPMPKGSTSQTEYHSLVNGWVNCFVGVPYFAEDGVADMTGFILEALARTSYQIVRPVAFDKVVMYQSVREPQSLAMLDIIYDTLYVDFHAVYDFGGWGTAVADYVYKNQSLTSEIAKIKDAIYEKAQEVATDWLNPRSGQN